MNSASPQMAQAAGLQWFVAVVAVVVVVALARKQELMVESPGGELGWIQQPLY